MRPHGAYRGWRSQFVSGRRKEFFEFSVQKAVGNGNFWGYDFFTRALYWGFRPRVAISKIENFLERLVNMCSDVLAIFVRSLVVRSLKNKEVTTFYLFMFIFYFFLSTETTYIVWTWMIWERSKQLDGRPPRKRCSFVWWRVRAWTTVTITSKYFCLPGNGCSHAVLEHFHRSARGER